MKATSFKILSGGEIIFLYDENSPILESGDLQVIRASNVEFDETSQRWYVAVKTLDGTVENLAETFSKRSEAIAHEIRFLNAVLSDGADVERFFSN